MAGFLINKMKIIINYNMDLYTDFLILLYRHLYKYKLLNYNNLSLNEKTVWPKWIGVDIKIKEYLKSHNYRKNYHEILAAKDGLQIIKFEKQIFLSMYNSIIKNKNTNNFNFCGEEAVSNGRGKKEKYHLHYSHWISTIFY